MLAAGTAVEAVRGRSEYLSHGSGSVNLIYLIEKAKRVIFPYKFRPASYDFKMPSGDIGLRLWRGN